LIFPTTPNHNGSNGNDINNNNIQNNSNFETRVWLAHKLAGELVVEHDPNGRPSLIERLMLGGVGK